MAKAKVSIIIRYFVLCLEIMQCVVHIPGFIMVVLIVFLFCFDFGLVLVLVIVVLVCHFYFVFKFQSCYGEKCKCRGTEKK